MVSRLDDPERLQSLRDVAPAAPGPDAHLDRLTAMVSFMVKAPVALISLVDDHRQVFAGAHGLARPWAQTRQTPLSHSFCQHVVTSGAPLVVEDSRADARVAGNGAIDDLNVQAYLGVPLVTQDGHTLGALCAIDGQPRAWKTTDLATLTALADTVARELELRRANKQLARERASVELLLSIAKAANHADAPTEAMRLAVEQICRYAGWPLGHVLLASDGKLVPTGVWHCDEPGRYRVFQAATEAMTFPAKSTLVGRVLDTGAPVWGRDLGDNKYFKRASAALYCELETAFIAPILVGDEVVAAIELYTPERVSAVADLMSVVAEAAALLGRVVERDRARQERESYSAEIERRSLRDEMTGLYNRRGFFTMGEQQLLMARRKRRSALVFFLDLDGLKETNDTHGHEAGDSLITGAAAMLRTTFRDVDVLARLGGDEFVVLAPEARVGDIEQILARLHEEGHRLNADRQHPLTWSVGIAELDPDRPETLEELVRRADTMMYEHKRRRRKRRSSLEAAKSAAS